MIPKSLIGLLEESRSRQITQNEVIETLKSNGWSQEIINEAQEWYRNNASDLSLNSSSVTSPDNPVVSRSGFSFLPFFLVIFSLIIFLSLTFAAYLIAYEKVSINNPIITGIVSKVVFGLPLLPKTAKYILYSASKSNKTAVRGNVEFSLISSSSDYKNIFDSESVGGNVSGYYNVTDPKNPLFDFSIKIGKDVDLSVRKGNYNNIYFKVNQFPPYLATTLKLDPAAVTSILKNWIVFDLTATIDDKIKQLDSVANDSIDDSTNGEKILKITTDFFLSRVVVSQDIYNGENSYRLSLPLTPEILNDYVSKIQEEMPTDLTYVSANDFKNVDINVWFNQKNYYFQKLSLAMVTKADNSLSANSSNFPINTPMTSDVATTFSVTLSDYGLFRSVDVPEKPISPQDLMQQLFLSTQPNGMVTDGSLAVVATPSIPFSSKPIIPPKKSENVEKFTSSGPKSVENNQAKITLNSVVPSGDKYTANITYSNPSSQPVTVYPIKTSVNSNTQGAAGEPAIVSLVLSPNETKSFSLTYIKLPDPPYKWKYLSSDGSSVELGTYTP